MKKVIVRFAPSPTGYLHVGGARTAIFNYLFAQNQNGKFLLRIENTDAQRSRDEMTTQIISSMKWLGLKWDDGIFVQSEHVEQHQRAISELLSSHKAYRCFCTNQELEEKRKIAIQQKGDYRYDRTCLRLNQEEIEKKLRENVPFTVRIKIPEEAIVFTDGVYGDIRTSANELDDFIIQRSDGSPVYHLAVVVDDHEMGITHVIRGNDHLSNTPKQIVLYQALGYEVPKFVHLPLILGEDKKRLSKRHGAASVEEFKTEGILPDALFAYLSLLGWSPGNEDEILTREKLIERFSLNNLNKSDAVFDRTKLEWINSQLIQKKRANELLPILKSLTRYNLDDFDDKKQLQLVSIFQPRMKRLTEFDQQIDYFFKSPTTFDPKGIKKHFKNPEIQRVLHELLSIWSEIEFSADNLEASLRNLAEKNQLGAGKLIHPVRLMVSGRTATPSLFEILELIGKSEVIKRITFFLEEFDRITGLNKTSGGAHEN